MKHLHLLHIGWPKTGTSWLWHQLAKQVWFNSPSLKENEALGQGVSVDEYCGIYRSFEITGNFWPWAFALDRYLIDDLACVPSIRANVSLRNPYELYWSFYNFQSHKMHSNFKAATESLIDQTWFDDFASIIDRWQVRFKDRFTIYFYDDLKTDASGYFQKYLRDNGLDHLPCIQANTQTVNKTDYISSTQKMLPTSVCDKIDRHIIKLQSVLDRDIKHWVTKRQTFEQIITT